MTPDQALDALNAQKGSPLTDAEIKEATAWLQSQGWTGGDISDSWLGTLRDEIARRYVQAPPPDSPPTKTGGGPPPERPPGILDPWLERFRPPTRGARVPAPEFQGPAAWMPTSWNAPAAFQAPTPESVLNDWGVRFRMQQGQEQLENSAAARGVLRTGNTLRDILDYGQRAASQEYGNAYTRAANEYDRFRTNSWNEWKGMNDASLQAYNASLTGALASFNPRMEAWQRQTQDQLTQDQRDWQNAMDEYNTRYTHYRDNQRWPYWVLTTERDRGLGTI